MSVEIPRDIKLDSTEELIYRIKYAVLYTRYNMLKFERTFEKDKNMLLNDYSDDYEILLSSINHHIQNNFGLPRGSDFPW